ncbi:hypothetical protein [Marinicella rhabdoformis]|uniref:hypothetical protein n=1 Tax=Marinicella rhabdoformis TaxID=2580566 RepID=UPI0012AECD1A|nr:hypothetical protein [Marinicella rhabdoformis]
MNVYFSKLLAFIVLASFLSPLYACGHLTFEERFQREKDIIEEESAFVMGVAMEADLIFIAFVIDEILREPKQEVGDNFFDVEFDEIQVLKGEFYSNIYWVEKDLRVIVSCEKQINPIGSLDAADKYLVYVKNGEILRARPFEQMPVFTEADELKALDAALSKRNINESD